LIITEKCVFKVNKGEGLVLIEIDAGLEIKDITASTGCHFKVKI
jgi:3-oxoacid CoA-transferase